MAVYDAGEVDNPNPVNGNLFLNIPLLGYPQLGHQLHLNFKIYYNDKKWFVYNICYHVNQQDPPCTGTNNQWTWSSLLVQTDPPWPNIMGVFVTDDQHLDFGVDRSQTGFNLQGGPNNYGSGYAQYSVTASTYSSFVAGADSAKHYIGDAADYRCTQSGNGSCPTFPSYPSETYPANDASGYVPAPGFALYAPTQGNTVTGPDGVKYSQGLMTDTSGNQISLGSNGWVDTVGRVIPGSASGPGTGSTTQTSVGFLSETIPGVPVSSVPSACPSGTTQARRWDVPSFGNNTQPYYLCYQDFPYSTAFNAAGGFPGFPAFSEASGTSTLMKAIVLPNGQSYTFGYDNYLSLTSLTLPTGASIAYTWQNLPFSLEPLSPVPMTRTLASRTITPGNGQPSRSWHYAWFAGTPTNYSAIVYAVTTDPEGNDTERQLGGTDIAGTNIQINAAVSVSRYKGCSPHDQGAVTWCSGVGTLLESEAYAFRNMGGPYTSAPNSQMSFSLVEPSTTVRTVNSSSGNLVNKKVLTYAQGYGSCLITQYPDASTFSQSGIPYTAQSSNITPCSDANKVVEEDDYDWGSGSPGPLMKKVLTRYQWQNDISNSGNCTSAGQSGYLSANLLDATQCVITQAGAEDIVASGTPMAEIDYAYDQSPSPSGARGNLTGTTKLSNVGQSPSTSTVYNAQGMPISQYDARGNKTQIDYDTSGLFIKDVVLPSTVTADNGVTISHKELFSFDLNTGRTTTHTDQNNNISTYSYVDTSSGLVDPLNRLMSITYPPTYDGTSGQTAQGKISYTYSDTPGSLSVIQKTLQNGNGNYVVKTTLFDGLGEVIQTQSSSDPQGIVYVDTTYDAMGRVSTVSNPYRSLSDTTAGLTTKTYDPLGRPSQVMNPDGSAINWCYNGLVGNTCAARGSSRIGTWTDVYDEVGNHVQEVNDGEAQVISVIEPNPGVGSGLETDYTYDSLGNLETVYQGGNASAGEVPVVRNFGYDSLSRLLWSYNPETTNSTNSQTGVICYGHGDGTKVGCQGDGYDLNGNLLYKTDARGVTAIYNYDSLNRITTKSFTIPSTVSSQVGPADSATFVYDTTASGSVQNAIGRLASEYTVRTNSPSTKKMIAGYDAMGRLLGDTQCVFVSGCSSAPYILQYRYDLAGNITSSSNGFPVVPSASGGSPAPIYTSYIYDSANRLQTITSNWNDTNHPTQIFGPPTAGAQYSSAGLIAAVLGTSSATQQPTFTMQRTYDVRLRTSSEVDSALTTTIAATSSTGNISITGTEGQTSQNTSAGTGTITFSGSDGYTTSCSTGPGRQTCRNIYGSGRVTVVINTHSFSVSYGGSSGISSATLASNVAAALNDPSSPVTATCSGSTVTMVSSTNGSSGNYPFTVTFSNTTSTSYFTDTVSGTALSGGTDGGTEVDSGAIFVNLNGYTAGVGWQAGSTVQSIANQLAASIQATGVATMSGSSSPYTITSIGTGSTANWTLNCSADDTAGQVASFAVVCDGMNGGSSGSSNSSVIYTYAVPASSSTTGFAPNGNLLSVNDSVMGNWSFGYDSLNRLTQATVNSGNYMGLSVTGTTLGWSYDSFGNRLLQSSSNSGFPSGSLQYSGSNNQAVGMGLASNPTVSGTTFQYDGAGNLTGISGVATNVYDAEGRLCATRSGTGGYTQYIYDAEGRRVAKGSLNTLNCDLSSNGFTPTNLFLLDQSGEQVTELDGSGNWLHSNVYAGGKQLATYDPNGLHFHFTDWQGTHRVQARADGTVDEYCQSLPFGDGLSCTGTDATEHHFTGKERDTESGLDYFGARYYAGSMGRWMSPDWSGKAEPVPYAKLDNPQSLNLYQYVNNNPLIRVDADGHDFWDKVANFIHGNGFHNTSSGPAALPNPAHTVSAGTPLKPTPLSNGVKTVGLGISGTVSAGAGKHGGAAATASLDVALSHSNEHGTQTGLVDTHAATAYAGNAVSGTSQDSTPSVEGVTAGIGITGFISNGPSIFDQGGPFETTEYNAGAIDISIGRSGGIWSVSGSINFGVGITNLTTQTTVGCISGCGR